MAEQSDYEITVDLLNALKEMGVDFQDRAGELTPVQVVQFGKLVEGRAGLVLAYLEDLRKRGRI